MNLIENNLLKLQTVLKACQKIKDSHDIDVYDMFGLYFHNDDRIEYNEKKCHAIISKHCTAESLIQCSKPRCNNDSSKKKHLYCQQHLKMASLGEIEMCIICPDISKKLHLESTTPSVLNISSTTPSTTPTPSSSTISSTTPSAIKKRLRYIDIDGKVYYVNQLTLSLYDMDMCEIGKYAYDPETDQHIICEM